MKSQTEIEKIEQAILALEAQRQALGDQVADTALAPLREKLASLQSSLFGEQRKLTTVLFADLAGFTALSSQMDPEELREVLNTYFARWRACIERHGGVAEKFIGDAVMAVFGLSISHEDDPERAIRAALDMQQELGQLNHARERARGIQLAMRVGINTGEVVVSTLGERQGEEFVVVGETVNLASRLQAEAPVGGILITYDTYRHVRGVFEVQDFGQLRLKGIEEPVQAYRVKTARPRAFRMDRRGVEGVKTDLVGREAELNRLRGAFNEAAEDGQLRVVTLVGEAGIGKSRLITEFEAWLDLLPQQVFYFKGRAHPSIQNAPYSLIRDVFAFRFQIQDSDPPPTVRQKLEQGYLQTLSTMTNGEQGDGGPRAGVRAAHFLGHLLGLQFGPSEHLQGAGQDAKGLHDQALIHLGEYFRALAQRNPVVVLLEDLHWADDSSLDLIHHLESSLAKQPLLIVGAARPVLFERRPHWGEGLNFYNRLDLSPLSRRDSRSLVQQILQKVVSLPEALREMVVATAEGNPFYIEELLKMLIEDGVIVLDEPHWRVESGRLADFRVPATLVGVLQARLDGLSPDERASLQRGSVIGRVFWDQAIEYLGEKAGAEAESKDPPTSDVLDRLRAREMIFKRELSSLEETTEYLFKHALLRDVTYESLLKRQRRVYHGRAARWLEQVTARIHRSDEFAALIAGHYEQAGEPKPASEWYWRAGQGAASRYAGAEAVHAFSRALDLAPAEDDRRRFDVLLAREKMYELQGAREKRVQDLQALSDLAQKLTDPARAARVSLRRAAYEFSISDFPAVIAAAEKASELAEAAGAMELAAEGYLLHASALIRQGSFELSLEHAQRALFLARQHKLPGAQANSLRQLGMIAYYEGNPQEARDYFEEALQLYIEVGDRQGEGIALNNLGGASFNLSDYAGAAEYYTRSLDLCRKIGDRLGEGRAFNNLGIIAVVQGDYPRAEEYYLHGLQICREIGHRSFEVSSLDNLGNLAIYRYEYTRGLKYHQEALRTAREIGDRVTESNTLLNLGRSTLATGDYENAKNYLEEGWSLNREVGDRQWECHALVNLSQYSVQTGDLETARQYAQQAIDLSQKQELPSEQAWAFHCLAEPLLELGQVEAAMDHYRAALKIRQDLGESGEAIDSLAGLLRALLIKGDLEQARVQVEDLLNRLQAQGFLGLDQPVRVLLTCYQILTAIQDPRALELLEQGYRLLQECAANIEDEALRSSFLEKVNPNRDLLAAWSSAHNEAG